MPIDIATSSKRIVAKLCEWTKGMPADGAAFKIYNEAIGDAIDFVAILAERNPQHRIAFVSLIDEMSKWLPLRLED